MNRIRPNSTLAIIGSDATSPACLTFSTPDKNTQTYKLDLRGGQSAADVAVELRKVAFALDPIDSTYGIMTEAEVRTVLPSDNSYLDDPDGGSVSTMEQLQRMAGAAQMWCNLKKNPAAFPIEVVSILKADLFPDAGPYEDLKTLTEDLKGDAAKWRNRRHDTVIPIAMLEDLFETPRAGHTVDQMKALILNAIRDARQWHDHPMRMPPEPPMPDAWWHEPGATSWQGNIAVPRGEFAKAQLDAEKWRMAIAAEKPVADVVPIVALENMLPQTNDTRPVIERLREAVASAYKWQAIGIPMMLEAGLTPGDQAPLDRIRALANDASKWRTRKVPDTAHNLVTHRLTWIEAINAAQTTINAGEDASFWEHERDSLIKTLDELTTYFGMTIPRKPLPADVIALAKQLMRRDHDLDSVTPDEMRKILSAVAES